MRHRRTRGRTRRRRAAPLLGSEGGLLPVRREEPRTDLYYHLLIIPWTGFFAHTALAYFAFNLLFAALYRAEVGSIANAGPSFWDAFFFSVQTMATIGYGDMHPATVYANVLVTVEVLLGLVGFALAAGVIFARISLPTARVMFSRVAVVTPHDGRPTLMFRVANRRSNRIVEATVALTLVRDEITIEGMTMRRFHDLKVERHRTPLFSISWTVIHVIDETSPFFGATQASVLAQQLEVLVTLIGLDETLSQTVHARHSYRAGDILFGRRLVDILSTAADGTRSVAYDRFHDTV
jgi:inward rectifier potassium channel